MTRPKLDFRHDRQVAVTGSLAFDQIMVFPGFFKDHILPDKTHMINISFLVSEMRKQRGGCSGNIAYSLALLGENPRIVATAGSDFGDYQRWLEGHGVDLGGVRIVDDQLTASCFITTDQADNQITGFFPGAMGLARELSLRERAGERAAVAIVAPDDPTAMVRHCREAREMGLTFVFDPSFQVTAMDGPALTEATQGAFAMVVNDYEYAVFQEKTGKREAEIFDLVGMVAVTLGAQGSRILLPSGEEIVIPPAKVERCVDPTGGGDAYRGGMVAGLLKGYELEVCGRMGSVAAAFAVEQHGTQNHRYTYEEFCARYRDNFGPLPDHG